MAFYPAMQRRLYRSAKDSFPERRNPLWTTGADHSPNMDFTIFDGRYQPTAFNYVAQGSAHPQVQPGKQVGSIQPGRRNQPGLSERRNPLWMSAEDAAPNTDFAIFDGRYPPSTLAYATNGSAHPQTRPEKYVGSIQPALELTPGHSEQNPLYRSSTSEVSANPSRPSRPANADSYSRRISEQEIQRMVERRALQLLQVPDSSSSLFLTILIMSVPSIALLTNLELRRAQSKSSPGPPPPSPCNPCRSPPCSSHSFQSSP